MATAQDKKMMMSQTELRDALNDFRNPLTRKQKLVKIMRGLCKDEGLVDFYMPCINVAEEANLDRLADEITVDSFWSWTPTAHKPYTTREKLYYLRKILQERKHVLCCKKLKLDYQEPGESDEVVWRDDFSELSDSQSVKETLDKAIEDIRVLETIFEGIHERMQVQG
ncbi:hypothetical protein M8818_004214 [Zalaria obscura]|uniref:Uncharacterized protein n=1 Tax=Zalaria obscura TaxID=2024903 RepID=A0ACC3SCL5_9PEZI